MVIMNKVHQISLETVVRDDKEYNMKTSMDVIQENESST